MCRSWLAMTGLGTVLLMGVVGIAGDTLPNGIILPDELRKLFPFLPQKK